MKQVITILGILAAVFLTTGNLAHTNVTGAPAGKTGSPGDAGSSCDNPYCHGYGSQNSGEYVEILVTLPLSSTDAYRVTVVAANSGSFQYEKAGFQACVEDAAGNKIGQIAIVDPTLTQIVEQDYITHTSLGTAPSSQSVNSNHMWEFDWMPPANFDGEEATIYAASMLTNNNGMSSGDVHVTTNYTFNVGFALDEADAIGFSVYPNPVEDEIHIFFGEALDENIAIILYDLKGAEVVLFEGKFNQKEYSMMLPSNLAKGIYTLSVHSDLRHSSQKLFLR